MMIFNICSKLVPLHYVYVHCTSIVAHCFPSAARLCWIRSEGRLCEMHLWLCRWLWRHDGWMQMCVFVYFKCDTVVLKQYGRKYNYRGQNTNISNNIRCVRFTHPPPLGCRLENVFWYVTAQLQGKYLVNVHSCIIAMYEILKLF